MRYKNHSNRRRQPTTPDYIPHRNEQKWEFIFTGRPNAIARANHSVESGLFISVCRVHIILLCAACQHRLNTRNWLFQQKWLVIAIASMPFIHRLEIKQFVKSSTANSRISFLNTRNTHRHMDKTHSQIKLVYPQLSRSNACQLHKTCIRVQSSYDVAYVLVQKKLKNKSQGRTTTTWQVTTS